MRVICNWGIGSTEGACLGTVTQHAVGYPARDRPGTDVGLGVGQGVGGEGGGEGDGDDGPRMNSYG